MSRRPTRPEYSSLLAYPGIHSDTNYPDLPKANSLFSQTIHVVGFPFDGTACFRKGTKLGPDALRTALSGIETYSPYLDADLEDAPLVDLGNLLIDEENTDISGQWQKATDTFLAWTEEGDWHRFGVKFLLLGGEHSVSYAPIRRYLEAFDDLVILHLDAHADLRDGYEGFHFSHASIIRRAYDHIGDNHKLIQYGIRSGTKEEYEWMHEHQTLCSSRTDFLNKVREIPADRPIYLTFDLDYFDPGMFPGTGTPEPGGEDFHSFISLIKILCEKNFVGADIVELSPPQDSSGISAVCAAKVVREVILALHKSFKGDF